MDSKQIKDLIEAYSQVHAPQEVDEAVKGASAHDTEMRKAAAVERKSGVKNRLSPSAGRQNAEKMERDIKYFDKVTKKTKPSVVGMTHEEIDVFDVVLEYLQTEGIVETAEEAEWAMANLIDEETVDAILDEATYSAKAARAGKDIGKPGKAFAKIAASAAKRYGSMERGKKVAGAVLAKLRKQHEEFEIDEAQVANRDPEKYEREQAKKTSKREKAMNDPHTGINSPAFVEFMRKQMGR